MDASAVTGSFQEAALANIAYTDVAKLERLKQGGEESLKQAAQQFESVFVNLWLKSMREAGAVFADGNMFSSQTVEMHQEMLDSQWAIHVAESGGLGLADVIERQLRGEAAPVVRDVVTPSAPAAAGQKQAVAEDRASFVSEVADIAARVLKGSGIPVVGVVAQAVLETGWGQHVPHNEQGQSSNNLFGIKATGWNGPEVTVPTREHVFGQWIEKADAFRAYESIADSIADLRDLLTGNDRYEGASTAQDVGEFADVLSEGGYATDPAYAQKLRDVAAMLMERFGVN